MHLDTLSTIFDTMRLVLIWDGMGMGINLCIMWVASLNPAYDLGSRSTWPLLNTQGKIKTSIYHNISVYFIPFLFLDPIYIFICTCLDFYRFRSMSYLTRGRHTWQLAKRKRLCHLPRRCESARIQQNKEELKEEHIPTRTCYFVWDG